MSQGKGAVVAVTPRAAPSAAVAAGLAAPLLVGAGVALLAVGVAATAVVVTRAIAEQARRTSDKIEAIYREQERLSDEADRWESAVLRATDVNARIAVLAAAAGRIRGSEPADPGLPRPINPAGRTTAELDAWCGETESRLKAADGRLTQLTVASALYRLGDGRKVSGSLSAATALSTCFAAKAPAPARVAGPRHEDLTAEVQAVLGDMPPDASEEDCALVLETAALVTAAEGTLGVRGLMDELYARAKRVGRRTEQRRGEVRSAARYLQALRLETFSDAYPATAHLPYAGVTEALERVLAGEEELTPELRSAADEAVLTAQEIADEVFIASALTQVLTSMRYEVTVAGPGALVAVQGPLKVGINVTDTSLEAEVAEESAEYVGDWQAQFDRLREGLSARGLPVDLLSVRMPQPLATATAKKGSRIRRQARELKHD
jgi:hypothetical protein